MDGLGAKKEERRGKNLDKRSFMQIGNWWCVRK